MKTEEYLKSRDDRFYVSDGDITGARAVIFEAYPTSRDLEAKSPVSALKTWSGLDFFDEGWTDFSDTVATVYISNVPLYSTSHETAPLTAELEGIRLSPRAESELLRESFAEKMRGIIENEGVRLIAYKLEIFKRYYDDFLNTGDTEAVNKLRSRLAEGSLAVLEFPRYTLKQLRAAQKCYEEFVSAFEDAVK